MQAFSINQLEPFDLKNDRKSKIILDTFSSEDLPYDPKEINVQVISKGEFCTKTKI